jgi:FtsZ-binding cell division protein ZapB
MLAASRTAEHPVHEQLRIDRRARLAEAIASSDTAFLEEYINELEAGDQRQRLEIDELKEQNAVLTRTVERSDDQLEAMRSNFAEIQRPMPTRQQRVPADAAPSICHQVKGRLRGYGPVSGRRFRPHLWSGRFGTGLPGFVNPGAELQRQALEDVGLPLVAWRHRLKPALPGGSPAGLRWPRRTR